MSLKNTVVCDGPGCDVWYPSSTKTGSERFTRIKIEVSRIRGLDPGVKGELDLCSLDCFEGFVRSLRSAE